MTKIVIAHNGVEDIIISHLQNELQEKMKQILNQEEIELLIDTYSSQYTYPLDCDELFLLCSVSTAVNRSLFSTDCHIIPIAYGEVMEQKDMDSSLQNINAFLYDEGNSDKSIEQLCEIILSRMGLMKNATVADKKQGAPRGLVSILTYNALSVDKMVRFVVGEGMQKREEDFAAEVAKQMGK